jgi:hypothetical protein
MFGIISVVMNTEAQVAPQAEEGCCRVVDSRGNLKIHGRALGELLLPEISALKEALATLNRLSVCRKDPHVEFSGGLGIVSPMVPHGRDEV